MTNFTERFYPIYNSVKDDLQIARQAWQEVTESGDMSFEQLINLHNKIDKLWQLVVELEKVWSVYCATYGEAQKSGYELARSVIERICLEELAPVEAAYTELSK